MSNHEHVSVYILISDVLYILTEMDFTLRFISEYVIFTYYFEALHHFEKLLTHIRINVKGTGIYFGSEINSQVTLADE